MGSIFSTLLVALQTFKGIIKDYDTLLARISESPGIPVVNSTLPYWTIPNSPIAQHGKDAPLPEYADVVIIGSGVTGTSVAKAILELADANQKDSDPIQVVMVEARDACSGATGRNGGHASPIIYNEYEDLKNEFGVSIAQQILRYRIAHINALIEVAREENVLSESQARLVEDYDAFLHPELFEQAKAQLDVYLKEVPEDMKEYFSIIDKRSDIDKLQLSSATTGLIVKPGAAIHAYRFVTGILTRLLNRFSNFQLYTSTPVTAVKSDKDSYVLTTPKGSIRTRHVIHATNAWASHLLPGLRKKIIPVRAHMTAQRPGKGLSPANDPNIPQWAGTRAFVFYPSQLEVAYEYLTQLLPSPSPNSETPPSFTVQDTADTQPKALAASSHSLPTAGEFMYGGGVIVGGEGEAAMMNALGVADDSGSDFVVDSYLAGSLERYFAGHWGEEGNDPDTDTSNPPGGEWEKGRVKAFWTGIVGISADLQPWVGRVPRSVSGRKEPKPEASSANILFDKKDRSTSIISETNTTEAQATAPPGEWVCAGYTGEGMVHAWLSGQALARMVLGVTEKDEKVPEMPKPFLITEKRVKAAKIERLMERIGQ
ncbi:hypothetical protein CVT26_010869 [Gymnopilus dilepis]|uniref:FAD dependent oxidoreductase domain-containing protein n=1 Tax=Gymnopilus dilepis TaxID=231916 RepID=A0A409VIU6_9AGAR|nr:hypothetical protein CVT26_010869 [Gymnopilus dilepis]